jgi:hypothetical protein
MAATPELKGMSSERQRLVVQRNQVDKQPIIWDALGKSYISMALSSSKVCDSEHLKWNCFL